MSHTIIAVTRPISGTAKKMFKVVEKNNHSNLFDEMIYTQKEAEESLSSHQKQYPNIELIILGQAPEYWNATDLGNREISQKEADKLAEMGYTMEDIHNMSNEYINELLQNY